MHYLELSPTSKFDWKANPTIVPMYTAHLTHTSNLLKYLSLKVATSNDSSTISSTRVISVPRPKAHSNL